MLIIHAVVRERGRAGCAGKTRDRERDSCVGPGDVVVVTFRSDRDKAVADLQRHGIRYTDLVLVDSFDQKAQVIAEKGIAFFIDSRRPSAGGRHGWRRSWCRGRSAA